jgi:hypothetical protein
MGTSDHLRGVGTAGSIFKTSRLVAFGDRLVGSRRRGHSSSCLVLGNRHCPRRLFSFPSYREEAVGLENP